ncbi:MAG: hypothetical protein IE909_17005 [Campylobacterales bacterium]|nr:hypothetical protein [Campylobacterales bacterium]
MAEKLITVLILSTIFVRGKMYKEGDEVQVNEREAKELINRGVATDETDVTVEEDTTVAIEDMKKNELVEYAAELGIDVPGNATKAEIIELIKAADDEDGEE